MKDKPSFPPRMEGWEYQYKRAEKYLKLLREARQAIEHGYHSRTLIERIEKELGDG